MNKIAENKFKEYTTATQSAIEDINSKCYGDAEEHLKDFQKIARFIFESSNQDAHYFLPYGYQECKHSATEFNSFLIWLEHCMDEGDICFVNIKGKGTRIFLVNPNNKKEIDIAVQKTKESNPDLEYTVSEDVDFFIRYPGYKNKEMLQIEEERCKMDARLKELDKERSYK